MPTSQATFSHHVYRDFALITLAAIGVGLLFSLTIATAIVLTHSNRDVSAQGSPTSQALGPKKTRIVLLPSPTSAQQGMS